MSSTTLTIRLPSPLRAEIVERAENAGISTGEAARQLLIAAIEAGDVQAAAERGAERGARAGVAAALDGSVAGSAQ